MNTSTPTNYSSKIPDLVRHLILWWLMPKSKNRDEAFHEKVLRSTLAIITVLGLLSFLSTIFVFEAKWTIISFPTLHVVGLLLCFLSAYSLIRGKHFISGSLLTLILIFGSSGLILLGRQAGTIGTIITAGIPVLMFAPILAAMVLPRYSIIPVGLVATIAYAAAQFLIQLDDTPIPGFIFQEATVSVFLLILIESVLLRQLRLEFDARFDTMRESIEQTENARHIAELARQRAEQADKAKSQFLANMSHELRTPLNAIIGYSDAMIGGMAGSFTDQQKTLLGHIRHNGRRLLALINDILDLSKIEAGALEIFLAPMSPRKTIEQTVESLRSLADEKAIELSVKFDKNMPEVVLSDAKKLEQITVNLLSNAIKFTTEGGVYIEANHVDSEMWQLKVRDTGSGMPADANKYIFEPFKQVDSSVTRKHRGTGLGLSITKHLVDRLGGSIEVDTMLGKGTTFTVSLPIAKIHEPDAATSESMKSNITL